MQLNLELVPYDSLTPKQQEIYNFQKVAAVLADYGFNCIKLDDDWEGADFLAYHRDGQTLKVQLKGRLTIRQDYWNKDLIICFPHKEDWYFVPHNKLLEIIWQVAPHWLESKSWQVGKREYHSGRPSRDLLAALTDFKLTRPARD